MAYESDGRITFDINDLPYQPRDLMALCHVDERTVRRWLKRTTCPSAGTWRLIEASVNLGALDPEWQGWRVVNGQLISPENWMVRPGEVRGIRLAEQRVAALEKRIRDLEEQLGADHTWVDQPTTEEAELELQRFAG
jgi:Phage protein